MATHWTPFNIVERHGVQILDILPFFINTVRLLHFSITYILWRLLCVIYHEWFTNIYPQYYSRQRSSVKIWYWKLQQIWPLGIKQTIGPIITYRKYCDQIHWSPYKRIKTIRTRKRVSQTYWLLLSTHPRSTHFINI